MYSRYSHSSPITNTTNTSSNKRKKRKHFLYRYRRLFYLGAGFFLLFFCIHSLLRPTHHTDSFDLQSVGFNEAELNKLSIDTVTKHLASSTLEDPTIQTLIDNSNEYPLIKGILMQLEKYPDELVALAAKKPETIDFVAHYLKYLSASSHPDISIDSDYTPGSIPFFLQWDERWGYEKYGDDLIAINGCGPTCLSMVAVGLTANTSLNPKAVADFSYNEGYLVSEQGTSWALMSEGAASLGLDSQMIPADPNLLHNLLKEGTPIIASMSPGHFTTEGHFIVLYDIDDDDLVSVHDPDSITRSKKPWPLSTILDECKCLWQFKSL